KPNKLAIIEILNVYAYSNLVETYGDIPYSEALDIDHTLPKFDDAMTVYKDLLQRLDAALAQLNSETSFTVNEDLIYQGNADSWRKFGNTLKLRMGMTLADVDAALSKATVESAVSGGVFASNDDTAEYAYSAAAPNNNPVNDNLVLSGRNDYVAAQTLVDIMNALKDPRRADYFDPNIRETIGTVASVSTGGGITTITFTENYEAEPIIGNNAYIPTSDPEIPLKLGVITAVGDDFIEVVATDAEIHAGDEVFYGIYKGAQPGRQSRYVEWTHVNRSMVPGDVPGVLLSYIEAEFLMAEGAARGYNVGGSAEDHYNAGIAASFEYWGTPGLSAYLANPDVAYASAIANSTATPAWNEVIGTKDWIALYNETFANWLSVRRLDYPNLVQPYRAKTGYPVRYTYPVSEQYLNPTNYAEAANAIGGDAPETRLFWDKFYTFDF